MLRQQITNVSTNWDNGTNAGPFTLNANNAPSNAWNNNGAHQQGDLQNSSSSNRVEYAPCPLAKIAELLRSVDTGRNLPSRPMNQTSTAKNDFTLANVATYGNAFLAHANAKRHKRHYASIKQFETDLPANLHKLVDEFAAGTYRTGEYTLDTVNDSGKVREIAKVGYRDRVAQWMIANYYQPYLGEVFSAHSHAAILKKGIHTALRETEHYIRTEGYTHCYKFDVRKYFPHVNRAVLKSQMDSDTDDEILRMILRGMVDDAPGGNGIPIGNYLSQFLANRYLTPFDKWLEERGIPFVRYMDDVCIYGRSFDELRRIARDVEWYLASALFLEIKPNWQIFRVEDRGVDFVGYRVFPDRTILRRDIFARMRRKVCRIRKKVKAGDVFTEKMQSALASYLGWIAPCSQSVRWCIFDKYFAETLNLAGVKLTKRLAQAYLWRECHDKDKTCRQLIQTQITDREGPKQSRSIQTSLFSTPTSGNLPARTNRRARSRRTISRTLST